MRYWLDCEFIEDGKTIDLISIGIVSEDGRELYLQSVEFDESKASPWVQEHVLSSLLVCPHMSGNCRGLYAHRDVGGQCAFRRIDNNQIIGACTACPWRTRGQIKNEILAFMDVANYGKPELHGWCAGYDFVALCQLFGTMMDVPQGYPHYMRDLQQELDHIGLTDEDLPPQKGTAHNALEDARHIMKLWKWLEPSPLPELSDSEREQWGHILSRRDVILHRDFE